MRKFRVSMGVILLVAAAMLITAGSLSAKVTGKQIIIGAGYPLTGNAAQWGQHSKIGTEIAIEEINAAGGIHGVPLKLVLFDDRGKPEEGIAIARKLATRDKALIMLGPIHSSLCEVLFPQLGRIKIPVVSPTSAKPGLAKLSNWGFRNSLTSDKQLAPSVRDWAKKYGIKKAVIIYDSADAVSSGEGAKVFPAVMKNLGIKNLGSITYQTGTIDFSAQITKIKQLKPDGVLVGGLYQEGANILREARKQGLMAPFVGGVAMGTPDLIRLAGPASEGTYSATAGWVDNPDPKVQRFIEKFVKRAGKKPNYGGMRSYDSIYITKMIIEKYGVTNKPGDLQKDRERIRKGWSELKNFPGISGTTTMDEDGDGKGTGAVLIVKDGKWGGYLP